MQSTYDAGQPLPLIDSKAFLLANFPVAAASSVRHGMPCKKMMRRSSRKAWQRSLLPFASRFLPDNAACEGFFGRLKTELFYPRNWQSASIEQFIQALDSYIRWYNEKRIKISLGALSPVEYRESLGFAA
jgi:hypothetical protein